MPTVGKTEMFPLLLWMFLVSRLLSATKITFQQNINQTSRLVTRLTNPKLVMSNTSTPLDSKYDIVEGDMLFLKRVPGVPQLALKNNLWYWQTVKNGKYEIPYDDNFPTDKARRALEWTFRYVEMGSNLLFRPAHAGDRSRIVIKDEAKCCCTAYPMGQRGVELNLWRDDDYCYELGSVVHELLHALGFIHEQSRKDRGQFLDESLINTDLSNVNFGIEDSTSYTEFDYASIMLYSLGNYGQGVTLRGLSPDSSKYKGQRMFLSTCDWHAINTVYPGDRLPPKCIPGELPNYLDPVYPDDTDARHGCYYSPSRYFFEGKCRFRNGKNFPDLDFIPTKSGQETDTTTSSEESEDSEEEEEEERLDDDNDDDNDDDGDAADESDSTLGESNASGESDDGSTESVDEANTKPKGTTSVRSYCAQFTTDPSGTVEECMKTCLKCGRIWKQNLTKKNIRRCVKKYNSYCHVPDVSFPTKHSSANMLEAAALVLTTVLGAWYLTLA